MSRLAGSVLDRLRSTLIRRGRTPGLRTAKVTLAVVAAYMLAEVLHLSEHPIVAPLVALLVVQLTLYQSLVHGLGRVGGVLAGVAVAVLVAHFVGLTWWSLGAVVAGSIVVGKVLRLGPHLFEAPISAMLLLEVGGGGTLGLARVEEAILGALVGIAVSMLVAPPLYLQPAGEAIGELAERMARFAAGFADGVREPWSRPAADHWMGEARAVARRGVARRADRHPGGGGGADEPARAPRPRRPSALPEHADRAGTLPPDTAHAGSRRPGPHVLRARRRAGRGLHAGAARRAGRRARLRGDGDRGRRTDRGRRRAGRSRPAAGRGAAWSSWTTAAPASPGCWPSTRRSTRRRGPSTARCWPPWTGCGWRSPRPPARSSPPCTPRRRSRSRSAAGSTRWRPRPRASPTDPPQPSERGVG